MNTGIKFSGNIFLLFFIFVACFSTVRYFFYLCFEKSMVGYKKEKLKRLFLAEVVKRDDNRNRSLFNTLYENETLP